MEKIIGRKEEIQLLKQALQSKEAGFIAAYGRRRVGKTFLIHTYFKDHVAFELTGMDEGSLKAQLLQFGKSLQTATAAFYVA
jgi:AAA+ ATPase superfamily predicted ATPase